MSERLEPTQDPRIADEGFKKRYAAETLRRPNEGYAVSADIIGRDTEYNIAVSVHARNVWEHDITVIMERKRLLNEHGEMAELPTKETVMKEVLTLGRNAMFTVTDRLNAYKVYNEMMGYTGRNSGNAPSTSIYANKVLLVKDKGTDEEWEASGRAQQKKLIQDARDDAERSRLH